MRVRLLPLFLVASMVAPWLVGPVSAQKGAEKPPHGQDRMPGPALKPHEAIQKMTVPPGFSVELVASEPDIVNPTAMTFDEQGRIWICESLEYPRSSAGAGRDRVKLLESTRGDGRYDKVGIVIEGLNIPSGIAVGHGGVWVANSPDILFYPFESEGKLGRPQVVVSGFGRTDTHELPNSLTWGPDGWLYGLNGVFNYSHVKHQGKEFRFTCAVFRIHPKTREFQLFAEGTSNPWGIALNTEGSIFLSACVIDHLWHITESGYYHRQGGPYPPHTWVLGSIVKHKHQKAAYCGIHFFDSDAYPPEYRERLYMGNIHGGCINVDVLQREGSTYFAKPAPDFLSANDAWFMPVAQKTGPDGCLYILDWYDRYHCYQDARRDPQGIDRLNGRLYRIRYKDAPRAGSFNLGQESDEQLIARLHGPNVFFRDLAQRVLTERGNDSLRPKLEKLVLDECAPRKARMHALWSLVGMGPLAAGFHAQLLTHNDPAYRAWGVRAAGNAGKVTPELRQRIVELASDRSPDVQVQVAIAARKIEGIDALAVLAQVLASSGHDPLIPGIVWQNLHPLLEDRADAFLKLAGQIETGKAPNLRLILPRIIDRVLAMKKAEPTLAVGLLNLMLEGKTRETDAARKSLQALTSKVQNGEISAEQLPPLRNQLLPLLRPLLAQPDQELRVDAGLLAAALRDPAGLDLAREALTHSRDEAVRLRALEVLTSLGDPIVLKVVLPALTDIKGGSSNFRGQALAALGRLDNPALAAVVLEVYPRLEVALKPRAIELLTQRPDWGKVLLQAVAQKKVLAGEINANQARRLLAARDPELVKLVRELWGSLREDRNPEREKVVSDMRDFLKKTPGDPVRGMAVFKTLCAQCHKIHGEGVDVGPDITLNGRASFDQLLSNVFDPSLVIGVDYQAVNITTSKGRAVTGLLAENGPERVVLKTQGGKLETIPRSDIEEMSVSRLSMMPEGVEKQLKPGEIADLFAFLCLDKPPGDPAARKIAGAP